MKSLINGSKFVQIYCERRTKIERLFKKYPFSVEHFYLSSAQCGGDHNDREDDDHNYHNDEEDDNQNYHNDEEDENLQEGKVAVLGDPHFPDLHL